MTEITKDTDFTSGVKLLIDKELTWTSFDVVNKIKSLLYHRLKLKKLKVGHAGTLDPLASGLMIIATGKATKQIQELQSLEKEYVVTIKLGETTPSYDLETEINQKKDISAVTEKMIEKTILSFKGDIQQVPPVFSAKKVSGKRAYSYARKGEDLELEPVLIKIHEIEILNINLPFVKFRVNCSKGTYIRSLARDIGEALKCGAHLTELVRTAIGDYKIENATSIKKFEQAINSL